jgi:hypothetical protein
MKRNADTHSRLTSPPAIGKQRGSHHMSLRHKVSAVYGIAILGIPLACGDIISLNSPLPGFFLLIIEAAATRLARCPRCNCAAG